MDETKFKKLMENQDFAKKVFETKTPEEFKSLFSKEGVEITDKDLEQILKAIAPLVQTSQTVEIKDPTLPTPIPTSDSDLSNVTGGVVASSAALGAGIVAALAGVSGGTLAAYLKGKKDGKKESNEDLKKSLEEIRKWCELLKCPSAISVLSNRLFNGGFNGGKQK